MDEFLYLIVIIGLTIFIIFFGGHNNQEKIEYDSNYFNNLNSIVNFEKKINFICLDDNNNVFKNKNFVNIDKYLNTTNILIQNYVDCFLIRIEPNSIFNIYNLIGNSIAKFHMMVIFNHSKYNNLELLINNNLDNYYYNLEKNISITGIYHIYNNSNKYTTITCFILKKPFWHK
jgi:hypothetical protein